MKKKILQKRGIHTVKRKYLSSRIGTSKQSNTTVPKNSIRDPQSSHGLEEITRTLQKVKRLTQLSLLCSLDEKLNVGNGQMSLFTRLNSQSKQQGNTIRLPSYLQKNSVANVYAREGMYVNRLGAYHSKRYHKHHASHGKEESETFNETKTAAKSYDATRDEDVTPEMAKKIVLQAKFSNQFNYASHTFNEQSPTEKRAWELYRMTADGWVWSKLLYDIYN